MMRVLSRLGKKKRALSNIIAYVLLIGISISLSVMVYSWLRFYVSEDPIEECSDNVNIIIRSYECFLDPAGEGSRVRVVLKNKGLFTVDGYVLRVHDRPDADFGFYVFNETGSVIVPGGEVDMTYYFKDYPQLGENGLFNLTTVSLVEIQPFMKEGAQISCKSYAFQEVVCQ